MPPYYRYRWALDRISKLYDWLVGWLVYSYSVSAAIPAAMPGCRGLADSRSFAERISRPHFTTPKVWPAVPSPPLVVWLLYTTTYISPQEVTYLCLCFCSSNYHSYLYAVHEALFFFTIVLRLVEAHCLVCCGRDTFSLPLMFIPRLC
ncbi:hypothetical protein K469DRAFT_792658 [Zopfia rhizophila CBS 207.26]|uniref:Uncharacterized protein n=1 Tax=Zopfia rhizophila CBS 207.26 TaxID=1314779 RepID=A0A6A6DTA0_9PEZI|nr:hypothetical protein K469DRAFT_792658 [Zopfia rhizophila CBS 207.26]